ncbi:hypothetical protein [Nocardioides sp. CER19]|uniref:hypothetical protein n=1 Tax=Nocardioides sp. CER19 TaxID=3038538 RepID=UPI00244CAA51|nr:hypothetical protein [Nocardioides sp. CER19]MDH2413787.1 hypothetical protein [Nocardioides sp. CER19]
MTDVGGVSAQGTYEVDVIASAALACPAVAALDQGGTWAVATYLPGRRVIGVRIEDSRVLVSVVLAAGYSVPLLEAQVRRALAAYAGGRQVDVHVADLDTGTGPSGERDRHVPAW